MSDTDRKPDARQALKWVGRSGLAVAKTAVAGAVIAAIAFAMTVVGEDGTVSDVRADIFDLSFYDGRSNQQRFTDSLEALGHPEPRMYELNGNIIHFSVNYREEDPADVMQAYQREFADQGLNDEPLDAPNVESIRRGRTARLTGGIAPIRLDEDRVVLGGMRTRNGAESEEELIEQLGSLEELSEEELFRGHRWIEIFRRPGSDQTTVLASWSDENFSYEKMMPQDGQNNDNYSGVDPVVPVCPDCTRINQFADPDDARGFRTNIFLTSWSWSQIAVFYRRAMANRDFEESDVRTAQQHLRGRVRFGGDEMETMSFEHGDQRVQVFGYPHEAGSTAIHTVFWKDSDEMIE